MICGLCGERNEMKKSAAKNGFSLSEVLMASAILAVGLLLIAGTFPVAIFLTASSVEQTIAPIVADEAFAKIQLYGINFPQLNLIAANPPYCADFNNVNSVKALGISYEINGSEYLYPSASGIPAYDRVYSWSALCRKIVPFTLDPDTKDTQVQVTVFVSRKPGSGLWYPDYAGNKVYTSPTPVKVTLSSVTGNRITISQSFLTDGCAIVSDTSGNIYRVLDHFDNAGIVNFVLDKNWNELNNDVWLIPPALSGGRSPCIGVYQRIIRF
jgi:prepilin-type N-terminal cleavage/methylation domain-containing protein